MNLLRQQAGLRILLLAVTLAVTALSAVGFFAERVRLALSAEASAAIAADLVIEQGDPIPPAWAARAERLGLQTSRALSFPSVLFIGQRPQLVQVKAVEADYPLRGRLRIQGASGEVFRPPDPGLAVAEPRLVRLLGEENAEVELGTIKLQVVGRLEQEPDIGASLFQLAPRLLVHKEDALRSGLLGPASRARYRLLVAGPRETVARLRNELKPLLPPGTQLLSADNARPELTAAIERARRFLSLAALCASLLSGVAILLAARDYLGRSLDEAAILRTLGMSSRLLLWRHLRQLLLVGLLAALMGALLGWGLQQALSGWLGGELGAGLPTASWRPIPAALGHASLLLFGFALPSIWSIRRVSPMRVLRRDLGPPGISQALLVSIALGAWLVLVYWQIDDVELATRMGVAALGALGLFAGMAWILLRLFGIWRARGVLPLGLLGIVRHPGLTLLQLAGFGSGLSLLLLLGLVRGDLVEAWQRSIPDDAPNYFLINIQPGEVDRLSQILHRSGVVDSGMYPTTRARLVAVNEREVRPEFYREMRARRLASREYSLGFGDIMQSDNRLLSGRWWRPEESAFSVEEGVATALGIQVGDMLHFDLAGQRVSAPVLSLRKVRWDSFHVNFFVQGSARLLQDTAAAHAFITSIHLRQEQEPLLQEISRQLPAVSAISIGPLLQQVRRIIERGTRAVEAVFLFTLGAAMLVSLAALQLTRVQREREIALMRALGGSRRQVRLSLLSEFGLIGLLAGLISGVLANGLVVWLGNALFGILMLPAPVTWLFGPAIGVLVFGGMAWFASRPLLLRSPMGVLR